MLHIPLTNNHLLAARQDLCQKAHLLTKNSPDVILCGWLDSKHQLTNLTKNIEQFFWKSKQNGQVSKQEKDDRQNNGNRQKS